MNAAGATGYTKATQQECQTQCLSMTDCVAFDFDPNNVQQKCWIHTTTVGTVKAANGVTHYTRVKCSTSGKGDVFSCSVH